LPSALAPWHEFSFHPQGITKMQAGRRFHLSLTPGAMPVALLRHALAALISFCTLVGLASAAPPSLEIPRAAHLSIIGNTLADRMQHDGWLETFLQSRFPGQELTVRHLGFSGDELTLRLRSENFGSPDQWLTKNRTDIVFAFFGYNESFAGPLGIDLFKKNLQDFIHHTLGQKYNGKSAPQLVLFSPIAHENLHDRNLPDGSANNQRLEFYTQAMASIAQGEHVRFIDLFKPTLALYGKADKPLTINGVHLNEHGNRMVAELIDAALFGPGPARDAQALEAIRQAVLDKNFYWFNRYRTVDGYSIYGGRAGLVFVDGQTNKVVMDREIEVLDVMTANRDRHIWVTAQGKPLPVDDANTPPFIPVKTNKPGSGPDGTHIYLDGEQAISRMKIAKGMKLNLFASEKEFPELVNPVQMAFDTKGRLWVAAWSTYPHWKPKEEMNDKLLILEDTDGDGKADKCTVFADHLHCPTGFAFWNGGVLVAQAPDLMFLKDTTGGDKANVRIRVLDGLDSADTHHTANSFVFDPGGALYFQEGTFHHTQVETAYGPPVRCANAGVFRYEPRAQKFEVYVSYGFANPHGHVFDRWGQDIVIDGTGANPYHAALFSGRVDFPHKHAGPPQVYAQRTRPCPGAEFLSSRHFPESNQGNLLVANVIGFQGILQYKIGAKGSSFEGTEEEPIVYSSDPNFRPSDIKISPDGAIYFSDWQNPIIGHMQHNLRDPSRGRTHGRVYRVIAEGRPLLTPVKVAGEPIAKLLDLLKEPEDRVRYRARIELSGRNSDDVIASVATWVAGLDKNDPEHEHHLLEALWVHQQHNVVNRELLQRVLESSDFRARAAATRVLCYWRDRVPDALDLLKKLAADPEGRVRLEAIRAASFFTVPKAVEVAVISADKTTDAYLDFLRGETMRTLEP
jgi:glucose/arabinose dehydrogenase